MLCRRSLTIALLAVSACNTDPGKGKSQAAVGAASVEAPLNAPAGAVTYAFSNDGSKLGFVGAKVTAKHEGSFESFRGSVQLVDADPTKSSAQAEIDVASLRTEPAKLMNHLKTPDLLDVAQFPKATFASTSIRAGGDNGATHTITGNLTLHGVKKSIAFPAKVTLGADSVDISAEFVINRKDFGIVYPGMPDDLIKDDVLIQLALHAKKS